MSIDHAFRKTGVGASECAALFDLHPYQTAFDVWVKKVYDLEEPPATAIQMRGRRYEPIILQWYREVSGRTVEWFDTGIRSPKYSWMIATPDAWIMENGIREAEMQAKSVNYRSLDGYGDPGTDAIPTHVAIQCAHTMAVADTDYTVVAALCGLDDFRLYTVRRDAEIEAAIVEECDKFWNNFVLSRVAPPIGASDATTNFLKQRFPLNLEQLRVATPEECAVMNEVFATHDEFDDVKTRKEIADNRVKMCIANADGLLNGARKITWRKSKDSLDTDWQAAARELIERLAAEKCQEENPAMIPYMIADLKREMVGKHCVVSQPGTRRLCLSEGKKR